MKIQFREKGEISGEVLLEALESEQWHREQAYQQENCTRKLLQSLRDKCCGGSWLSLVLLVSIVIFSQTWLILYLLKIWGSFYTPAGHIVYKDSLGKLHHVHFSWSNCGESSDPVQAVVEVERRIGWLWVKIPCLDGLGSCSYEDVCELVPFSLPEPCPDPFPRFKLPCRCPALKGHYVVKDGMFSIANIVTILPAWLVSGDYYVHGMAYKNGKRLGCYTVYASISY
ncbi:ganglioside GM2 activator isoform X2 [Procambarus clarkii]|uniref:ganglioside GM2 activator isoform X2 n=1 Tax=Procambarus clarkii TaxID=6728 RepID=UPI001E6780F0|nr:ganglioside GM2 activator-like isoform X2 [Procambarus clarkii]